MGHGLHPVGRLRIAELDLCFFLDSSLPLVVGAGHEQCYQKLLRLVDN